MKKISVILLVVMAGAISAKAQTRQDERKRIEVQGQAEREIVPNKIIVRIALQEYKDGSRIIPMDKLESGLVKAVKKVGIAGDKLTVDNIYGYNWDWRKKKPTDFLASKSFTLEVTDVKMMNDLIEELDPEGVQSISLAEVTHTDMEKIKEELRNEALKNAQSKASSMLSAIGEELGGALQISETPQYEQVPYMRTMAMDAKVANESDYQSNVELKTMDIKVNVQAVFEIK